MANSITLLPTLQSIFFGQTHFSQPSFFPVTKQKTRFPCAEFNLSQLLGGRGLLNGEEGIAKELKTTSVQLQSSLLTQDTKKQESLGEITIPNAENGFEKEMMGLTGGFPGGEKGLQKFVNENPPPKLPVGVNEDKEMINITTSKKSKPPQLPLLMPGMIALVKNPNNPYYMYCGIVQRITDGKAGVLFEGGNWDRLITFRLEELERREKGPPMKNPKSVILESMIQQEPK